MKITAVRAETLELEMTALFVIASSPADATHCHADLPWRPGGYAREIRSGLRAELRDSVSTVIAPGVPGLGITLDEDAILSQRAVRRW